jgi:hypothetical protein
MPDQAELYRLLVSKAIDESEALMLTDTWDTIPAEPQRALALVVQQMRADLLEELKGGPARPLPVEVKVEDRTPYEELILSSKAWNYLKSEGVQYIDEVQAALDKIPPNSWVALELRERLPVWRNVDLAVAKIEVAIRALEDLMRDEVDELNGSEAPVVAEAADELRVQVSRLRC